MGQNALDLFCGIGGASDGLAQAGYNVLGVESVAGCAVNHELAGHATLLDDVSRLDPRMFEGFDGIWASPPCQRFSRTGTHSGFKYINTLKHHIKMESWDRWTAIDPDIWILLQIGRYVQEVQPKWIVCEQVPDVMPIWHEYALKFDEWGYRVWCGFLDAQSFGVPQRRSRAILMASRETCFDLMEIPQDYVSVREALGWDGINFIGFPRRYDGRGAPFTSEGVDYRSRDLYPDTGPSQTVTEKARSWSRFRAYSGKDRIEVEDVLILQGFDPNRPLRGSRTDQFQWIANAIPPPMAKWIVNQTATSTFSLGL